MVTINLNDLKAGLLCLLVVAGIVLVIYLIVAVYHLVKTLKQSQKVLDDFEVVSHVASERTKQLDKLIDQAEKKIKSGQGILNSLPIIFSAISKIAKAVGNKNKKPDDGKQNKA